MTAAGAKRAIAYVASAYSSYSGCRQYLENIAEARRAAGPGAPQVDKLRAFFNHSLFIAANAERLSAAIEEVPAALRDGVHVAFTAHSIPESLGRACQYEPQLRETSRLVAEKAGLGLHQWRLVYQSRSGRPEDPWLGPDICDHLRSIRAQGVTDVVVMPIGFLSDHMEVLYDLDYEARHVCDDMGLSIIRASTVGTHPLFVRMLRELIEERLSGSAERRAVGDLAVRPDVCAADCCPAPTFPPRNTG
jgi:ferrochelatase